jgi:hypothetical protein
LFNTNVNLPFIFVTMKLQSYWILLLLISHLASAQADVDAPATVLHDREHVTHIGFQTNGWGIGSDWYLKGKDAYTFWKVGADLQFIRHEKEFRTPSQDLWGRSYFYGKLNSFFVIRPGFGQNHEFAEKLRKSGVQLSYFWMLGPDIGFLKPVYLRIYYNSTMPGRDDIIQDERYDPIKHGPHNIAGRSSSLMGLYESQIKLGLFFKGGLRLEYSNQDNAMKGMEMGLSVDVFPSRIEIMAEEIKDKNGNQVKNHFLFVAPYVKFFFGSKYDRK